MSSQFQRISKGELRRNLLNKEIEGQLTLFPSQYWHLYIKLEFLQKYENAETKADGKSFIRNVARAASLAEAIVADSDGVVIEIHGSVVHCIIPDSTGHTEVIEKIAEEIHTAYRLLFPSQSRVDGWRMTADWGKTLVVRGRGIHNDDSFVSLGNSANAPAKLLFGELARSPEESRSLKRFHLGFRGANTKNWIFKALDEQVVKEASSRIKEQLKSVRQTTFEVKSQISKQARPDLSVNASAAPLDSQQTSSPVSPDEPEAFYGWVMRADLDGFTSRVEQCFDNDNELLKLGRSFQDIMDEAANFAGTHEEMLVQLPWAGDNFTAIVTFSSKSAYDEAIEQKTVEFSLDFDSAIEEATSRAQLAGWAQAVAGGSLNGKSQGNVYVGSVTFRDRRFLVGVGAGVGRSTQAFDDLKPETGEIAIFREDWEKLITPYKSAIRDDKKPNKQTSSLFKKGKVAVLKTARKTFAEALSEVNKPAKTAITTGAGSAAVVTCRDFAEA